MTNSNVPDRLCLDIIRRAFDKTRLSVFKNNNYLGYQYGKRKYVDKHGDKTSATVFGASWLPDSLIREIEGIKSFDNISWAQRIDSKYRKLGKGDSDTHKISLKAYDELLVRIVQNPSLVDDFSKKISTFIRKNCDNHNVGTEAFIDVFIKELRAPIRKPLITNLYKERASHYDFPQYIKDYFEFLDGECDDVDVFSYRIALLSLVCLFPDAISIDSRIKLIDMIGDSIPSEYEVDFYKRRRNLFREFRDEQYRLLLNGLNENCSASSRIFAIYGPEGSGKTEIARYIYHYYNDNNSGKKYKHIWWIDASSSLEESLIGCKSISRYSVSKEAVISSFISEISNLDRERILIIIDGLDEWNVHRWTNGALSIKELFEYSSLDIVLTTKLSKPINNPSSSDWRSAMDVTWIDSQLTDVNVARQIFCYYYGESLELSEYDSIIDKIIEKTGNNILAIKMLAESARNSDGSLKSFYNSLKNMDFCFPNTPIASEYGFDDYYASVQISKLYEIKLLEDDYYKTMLSLALPEPMWFSGDELDLLIFNGCSRCACTLADHGLLEYDESRGFKIHRIVRSSILEQLPLFKKNEAMLAADWKSCILSINYINSKKAHVCTSDVWDGVLDSEASIKRIVNDATNDLHSLRKAQGILYSCIKHIVFSNDDFLLILNYLLNGGNCSPRIIYDDYELQELNLILPNVYDLSNSKKRQCKIVPLQKNDYDVFKHLIRIFKVYSRVYEIHPWHEWFISIEFHLLSYRYESMYLHRFGAKEGPKIKGISMKEFLSDMDSLLKRTSYYKSHMAVTETVITNNCGIPDSYIESGWFLLNNSINDLIDCLVLIFAKEFIVWSLLEDNTLEDCINSIYRLLMRAVNIMNARISYEKKIGLDDERGIVYLDEFYLIRCKVLILFIECVLMHKQDYQYRYDSMNLANLFMSKAILTNRATIYFDRSDYSFVYYSTCMCLSECLIVQKHYEFAISYLDRIKNSILTDQESFIIAKINFLLAEVTVARAYLGMSRCYYFLNDITNAFINQRRAVDIYTKLNDRCGGFNAEVELAEKIDRTYKDFVWIGTIYHEDVSDSNACSFDELNTKNSQETDNDSIIIEMNSEKNSFLSLQIDGTNEWLIKKLYGLDSGDSAFVQGIDEGVSVSRSFVEYVYSNFMWADYPAEALIKQREVLGIMVRPILAFRFKDDDRIVLVCGDDTVDADGLYTSYPFYLYKEGDKRILCPITDDKEFDKLRMVLSIIGGVNPDD